MIGLDAVCPCCGEAYTPRVNASGKRSATCEAEDCVREWRQKRVLIEMPSWSERESVTRWRSARKSA